MSAPTTDLPREPACAGVFWRLRMARQSINKPKHKERTPMTKLIRSLLGSLMILAVAALFTGCGGGNAKMDAALNDLEKTCEKTASIYQRMKAGDQAAGAEMTSVTAEFQSFSKTVQEAGTMSPAQQKRYQEIMDKYSKAMQ